MSHVLMSWSMAKYFRSWELGRSQFIFVVLSLPDIVVSLLRLVVIELLPLRSRIFTSGRNKKKTVMANKQHPTKIEFA